MFKMRCDICNKKVKNEDALKMHKSAKHSQIKKSGFSLNYKKIRNWGILIVLILLIGFGINGLIKSTEKQDEFAQCLTDEGVSMFGAYWCSACAEQKKMFGGSWKHINYTECSLPGGKTQTQVCIDEGISSYPTWEFSDGSRESGVLSISQFEERTNCTYE